MNGIADRFIKTSTEKQEQLTDELNVGTVTGEYLAKKAEAGFKKGITTLAYGFGGELSKEEQADFDSRKEDIKSLENNIDSFYTENRDTLYGLPYLAGAMVESFSNPLELAVNVGVGTATGGLSLMTTVGANILADAYVTKVQTETIEDRSPTVAEYAVGAVGSALPDIAGTYISRKFNFVTSGIDNPSSSLNPRALKEIIDDNGIYDGATRVAYQTQNRVSYGTDVVDVAGENVFRPNSSATFLQRRVEQQSGNIRTIEGGIAIDMTGIGDATTTVTRAEIPTPTTSTQSTFLQRRTGQQGSEFKIEGRRDMADTILNNELVTKEIKMIADGEAIDMANVRDSIRIYRDNAEKQTLLVADEYRNLLGDNPQKILDEIGYDGKALSRKYIRGADDVEQAGVDKLIYNATKDREILYKNSGIYGLDDIKDVDSFIAKNDKYINPDGKLKEMTTDEWIEFINESTDAESILKFKNNNLDTDAVYDKLNRAIKPNEADYIARYGDEEGFIEWQIADAEYERVAEEVSRMFNVESGNGDSFNISKLEFSFNKQQFFDEYGKMFDTKFKTVRRVGERPEVKLTEYGEQKIAELGMDKDKLFSILSDTWRSTNTAYGTSQYKPFSEIKKHFDGDTDVMIDFFMNLDGGTFLKNNSEVLNDIFYGQASEIARNDIFGTSSYYRIKNNIRNKFTNEALLARLGEVPSSKKAQAYSTVRETMDLAIDNMWGISPVETQTIKASGYVRDALRRGTMYFSGINEFTTNPFVASMRASKYDNFNQVDMVGYGVTNGLKKARQAMTGYKLPNEEFVNARIMRDIDIRKSQSKFSTSYADNVGYSIQQASEVNLQTYADSYTTGLLANLKSNFTELDDEVARVLKLAGVNEGNYDSFLNFKNNHLALEDNVVNVRKLYEDITPEAEQLKSVFNYITDDIGNINSNSIFRTQATDEMSKWLGMYRNFARSMNSDTLRGAMYYTTNDGIRKSRLSAGVSGIYGIKGGTITNGLGLLALSYGTGKIEEAVKGLVYGDRDFSERVAVAQTVLDISDETLLDAGQYAFENIINQSGLSPEMLKSQAPILSTVGRIKRTYKDVSEDKVGAFEASAELVAKEILSKRLYEFGKATFDTTTYNWDESKKVYGFSDDQMQKYRYNVTQNRITIGEIGQAKENLVKKAKLAEARADFLENKTDSFDKLPTKAKSLYNEVAQTSGMSLSQIEDNKGGFAVIWSESTLIDNKAQKRVIIDEGIKEMAKVGVDEVEQNVKATHDEFTKMSPKRQKLYNDLIKYMNVEDSLDARLLFQRRIGNIKDKNELKSILKNDYGVDVKELYRSQINN